MPIRLGCVVLSHGRMTGTRNRCFQGQGQERRVSDEGRADMRTWSRAYTRHLVKPKKTAIGTGGNMRSADQSQSLVCEGPDRPCSVPWAGEKDGND